MPVAYVPDRDVALGLAHSAVFFASTRARFVSNADLHVLHAYAAGVFVCSSLVAASPSDEHTRRCRRALLAYLACTWLSSCAALAAAHFADRRSEPLCATLLACFATRSMYEFLGRVGTLTAIHGRALAPATGVQTAAQFTALTVPCLLVAMLAAATPAAAARAIATTDALHGACLHVLCSGAAHHAQWLCRRLSGLGDSAVPGALASPLLPPHPGLDAAIAAFATSARPPPPARMHAE